VPLACRPLHCRLGRRPFDRPVPIWDSRLCQLLHTRQLAAAHSSRGQNRLPDFSLPLEGGQTWPHPIEAHSTGGWLSRYRLGSIEREREVLPGEGPQWEAAWRPRDDYRRYAAKILPYVLADGHSKAGREQCPSAGPLPMRLLAHFSVRAEDFVLHGKANGCGPRYEDGMRLLIPHRVRQWVQHWVWDQASDWGAPRQPAVPVFLIHPTRPPVCLAACPVAPRRACLALLPCVEPRPCLVHRWSLARSCVPADVRFAYPHPSLPGRLRLRLAYPQAGADPSTPSVAQDPWRQTLELRQAWERRELASEGGPKAKLGA
jgi:hypothetical protein